jgi:ABC-2 type transport system ATP-binding protein
VTASPVLLDVCRVSKSFDIPSFRRETIREHVLDLFRRRPTERLCVLNDVSLEVRRGETLGIMGRNGCGKSTLLKIMSGVYRADAGSVVISAPVTAILELGLGWNPDLDAVDNVLLIGSVMGLSLRELRASLSDILAFAGVERFANLALRHYSSGMAARLAYAVAFKAVREVLILDEVFAVGDAGFRERCEVRYRQLSSAGHTIVVVSHSPYTVEAFCSRAILIEQGRVIANGHPRDVARQYMSIVTEQQTGGTPERHQ